MSKHLAPILLIAFNRPIHFKKTLTALCKNKKAKESILYISIDGPRNKHDKKNQELIFNYINDAKLYFHEVNILKNEKNIGLSKNIINSVSRVLNSHSKIIVLEDDLVTSRSFLSFMNNALDYYQFKNKIWHITGFSEINDSLKKGEIFLSRYMCCWGWATWSDRWKEFNKNPNLLMQQFSKEMIFKFNLDGASNCWDQVIENKIGKINTWAVFWYASIFTKNGLCVIPWFSYVENIGLDGSGSNCHKIDNNMEKIYINEIEEFKVIDNLIEDKKAFKMIQKLNKKSTLIKILNYLIGYYFSYKLKTFIKNKFLNLQFF